MMVDARQRRSKQIASVLGPTLMVMSISEAINFDIWETSLPQVVYLNGVILFSTGVAVVRFHHRWRSDWTATITLSGWVMLVAGLFRLLFPSAKQGEKSLVTYAFMAGLCLFGLFLSFKAYR